MSEIIAMHCHVAEQKSSIKEFLRECKEAGVNTISITDHKTLAAYTNKIAGLSNEELEEFKDIKAIVGLELTGAYEYINSAGQKHNLPVDILGYNMDINKVAILNDWVSNNYISTDSYEFQSAELSRLISVAKAVGFNADFDNLKITEDNKFAARLISNALIDSEYVEYNIKQGLDENLKKDPRSFFTSYCKNPDSPFYIDMTQYLPKIEDAMDVIHKCGGKTILPHTAAYFPKGGNEIQKKLAWDESKRFTETIFEEYKDKLDGIEIIHPCYEDNEEFKKFLDDFSKNNNLYVVGGTDYHVKGERVATDMNDEPITDERLPGIETWIETYGLKEIKEIACEEKAKVNNTEEVAYGGER